jgi:hypothetical protein
MVWLLLVSNFRFADAVPKFYYIIFFRGWLSSWAMICQYEKGNQAIKTAFLNGGGVSFNTRRVLLVIGTC